VNAANWADSYRYLHHIYIGKNVAHQNRQAAFGIKQASDVILSQNTAYDFRGNGAANAGSCFGYQYDKHNLWIIYNTCYNSVYGIRQSDTGSGVAGNDVYIVGNVIYDIHPLSSNADYDPGNPWHQGTAIALWHGVLDRYVVDNTIYDVHDGINAIYAGFVDISGNLISQKDDHPENHFFDLSLIAHDAGAVQMDRNLFFDDATESYYIEANGADRVADLAALRAETGLCTHCVFANPKLVDVSQANFALSEGAPALGSNVRHAVYDTFQSLYGLDIFVDHAGNPRPSQPAIGAFELPSH